MSFHFLVKIIRDIICCANNEYATHTPAHSLTHSLTNSLIRGAHVTNTHTHTHTPGVYGPEVVDVGDLFLLQHFEPQILFITNPFRTYEHWCVCVGWCVGWCDGGAWVVWCDGGVWVGVWVCVWVGVWFGVWFGVMVVCGLVGATVVCGLVRCGCDTPYTHARARTHTHTHTHTLTLLPKLVSMST